MADLKRGTAPCGCAVYAVPAWRIDFCVVHEAAPAMLAALGECVEALEAVGGDGAPGDMPTPALDNARVLLAQVRG